MNKMEENNKNREMQDVETILNSEEYIGGGCIFTNGKLILGGVQKGKISGIGGMREENEKAYKTMYREIIEELFESKNFDETMIEEINKEIKPKKIITRTKYYMSVLTFEDLKKILNICKNKIKSKLYDKYPDTIEELIFDRKVVKISEIKQLILLPVMENMVIEKCFIDDIKDIIEMTNINIQEK